MREGGAMNPVARKVKAKPAAAQNVSRMVGRNDGAGVKPCRILEFIDNFKGSFRG